MIWKQCVFKFKHTIKRLYSKNYNIYTMNWLFFGKIKISNKKKESKKQKGIKENFKLINLVHIKLL